MTAAADPPFRPLPADVDLTSMDFFPLHDQRLMRSRAWLRAKSWRGEGPGLGFILMNLWLAAFRAVPAGSIEDDEDYLADIAQVSIEHWQAARAKALQGWVQDGGRWHHPVVSEIVWELWKARLNSRHEAALRSWKASAKRAMDHGREPPEQPPERLADWCAIHFPATSQRLFVTDTPAQPREPVTVTNADLHCEAGPKQSKGKVESPLKIPPGGDGLGMERGRRTKAGREWFNGQERRLMHELGEAALTMRDIAAGLGARVSPRFALVKRFADCWVDRAPGGPVLVFPSKIRADAFVTERGDLLREHLPQWRVRHATVDELRARKEATAHG